MIFLVYAFCAAAVLLAMLLDKKFLYGGPCWLEWIGLVILAAVWPLVVLLWIYDALRKP